MELLPKDLLRKCLLGVPYTWHDNLKAVCRSWEGMLNSARFYPDRNISGKSEQLICLLHKDPKVVGDKLVITIYDPLNGTLKRLTPIDDPHFTGLSTMSHCVAVNRKLVLFSGESTMQNVYIYDFESARWSRGADMPTPRSFFACSVSSSSGLVYVAGGFDENSNSLSAAETYNVEEHQWEVLLPMNEQHGGGCYGVFLDGKFMVLTARSGDRSVEVFNRSAGTGGAWEDMWNFNDDLWNCRGAASFSGNLYVFSDHRVMMYDRENNVWSLVAALPQQNYFITCVTEWQDCIFVSAFDFTSKKPISYR